MVNTAEDKDVLNQSLKARTKNKFNQLLSLKSKSKVPESAKSDETVLISADISDKTDISKSIISQDDVEESSLKKAEHSVEDIKKRRKKKHKRKNLDVSDASDLIKSDLTQESGEAIELGYLKKDPDNSQAEVQPKKLSPVKHEAEKPTYLEGKRERRKNKRKYISSVKEINQSDEKDDTHQDNEILRSQNEDTETDTQTNTTNLIPDILEPSEITSNNENESVQVDDVNLTGILIHGSDQLRKSDLIIQPVVKVHIIDMNAGNYLRKSDQSRHVTSFYESSNIDYILPVLTKSFNVIKNQTMSPVWEEMIVFNESYNYILNQDTMIVFEILDLAVNTSTMAAKLNRVNKGWNHIAWAFLKLKGSNSILNTEKKLRLQLYKPRTSTPNDNQGAGVYQMWKKTPRKPYNASLYVTIKPIGIPTDLPSSLRSLYPTQEEQSKRSILNEIKENTRTSKNMSEQPLWTRLPSQPCRIPRAVHLSLKPSTKGCFVTKFSTSGKHLACGCRNEFNYPIILYSIPSGEQICEFSGHAGLIYELDWSKDDKYLLSASADCTVQVWDVKSFKIVPLVVLPHPSFVYSAKFHSIVETVIVTGCYDSLIRVWSIRQVNLPHNGKLLQEMEGHKSHVNALSFGEAGNKLYSADGIGKIIIWNAYFTEQPSKKGVARDWTMYNQIDDVEFKGDCINHIVVHPCNHKLLVHTRNNMIRIFDLRLSIVTVRLKGFINYQEQVRSCITPCGSFVFSGSEDGCVHVWRFETGEPVTVYTDLPYKSAVNSASFHPHDNIIAFCANKQALPVLVYKYNFDLNDTKLENRSKASMPNQEEEESLLNTSKKHVSFDTNLEKSAKVKKAVKKIDSVLDGSLNSTSVSHNFSTRNPDSTLLNSSSIMRRPPSPASLSPHAFLLPVLAAEVQKQLLNSSGSSVVQAPPVKVSFSGKAKNASFSFKVPSTSSNDSAQWVKTLYNYTAARSDELSFNIGESLKILYKDSSTWWMGEKESTGEQGFFPVNYVKSATTD